MDSKLQALPLPLASRGEEEMEAKSEELDFQPDMSIVAD
jgi:hypothetical protein